MALFKSLERSAFLLVALTIFALNGCALDAVPGIPSSFVDDTAQLAIGNAPDATHADASGSDTAQTAEDAGNSSPDAERPDAAGTDTAPDVAAAPDTNTSGALDAGSTAPDVASASPDAVSASPDTSTAPPSTCGNLACDAGETAANCPVDCGAVNDCLLSNCQQQATSCMNSSNCREAFACQHACAPSDSACQQQCLVGKSSKTKNTLNALLNCSNNAGCASAVVAKPPGPVCGNGQCESGETTANCPQDCPGPAPVCGDGVCNSGETTANCSQDCPAPGPVCGNGVCDTGETTASCLQDCPAPAPVCGDGVCNSGETTANCPQDCPAPGPVCGNGVCESGETTASCPGDCPAAKTCTTYADVQPIFLSNCNNCHGHAFGSSCAAAANYSLIASYVASGAMPQGGSLSASDKAKIAAWATAKNACTTATCP